MQANHKPIILFVAETAFEASYWPKPLLESAEPGVSAGPVFLMAMSIMWRVLLLARLALGDANSLAKALVRDLFDTLPSRYGWICTGPLSFSKKNFSKVFIYTVYSTVP